MVLLAAAAVGVQMEIERYMGEQLYITSVKHIIMTQMKSYKVIFFIHIGNNI